MVDPRLVSLVAIVEAGSFTKAAGQLSLSQPAVSRHIRQLEDSLNVRIFEHSHNRFRLTPEGEIVLKYARRMIALSKNMEQALLSEREQIRSLVIGITHTAESSAILEALASTIDQFEDLNMRILTDTTDRLLTMLKNYELDFAFVEGRTGDPTLKNLMLDTDCLVLAVPPTHPLAKKGVITIDELKREKLILRLPNSNTRDLFAASLASQSLRIEDFNVALEIDSIASIKDLIRQGFGVSVLAKSACLDEVRKGLLAVLAIENLSMMREINIVYPLDFEHPELLQGIVKRYNEMQRK